MSNTISPLVIRQARVDDLPVLLNFEQAIIEYERPFEPLMQQQHFVYYNLAELIESDDAEVLVAEINHEIIASGYAKLKDSLDYLSEKSHSFLGFMFVSKNHRGQGINQTLIKHLIDWSKTKNMSSASLTVFGDNNSAIKAYKKLGFKSQLIEMRLDIQ